MPTVKDVGEPCAGEPHARFDGRELESVTHCHGASSLPYLHSMPGHPLGFEADEVRGQDPNCEPIVGYAPPRITRWLLLVCDRHTAYRHTAMQGRPSKNRIEQRDC